MVVDMYAGELDAMFVTGEYTELFSGITGYEDIATDTKVIIGCPIHGDFEQTPTCHLQGQGCPECGKLQKANSHRTK